MNKNMEAVFLASNVRPKKPPSTSGVKYNEELEKAEQKIIQDTDGKAC